MVSRECLRRAGRLLTAAAGLLAGAMASRADTIDVDPTGGLVIGAQIVEVTTLADSGPGSLRAALELKGPRIVVFGVAGYIELESDLIVKSGQVTIAGQTAPGTGVVIRGGTLRIRASQVVVEHLSVFAGATTDPDVGEKRDSITIYGSPAGGVALRDILLRNVSAGWGVDENVAVQGLVDGVRIERSLLAEGLRNGGHPKGLHSMNLLLGDTAGRVAVLGNVMATSNARNARLARGNSVSMLNNYIYGFGRSSTHVDPGKEPLPPGKVEIIGNVYRATDESRCNQPVVQVRADSLLGSSKPQLNMSDNIEHPAGKRPCLQTDLSKLWYASALSADRLHTVPGWALRPASTIADSILDTAGALPARRNPIDARIVSGIRDGSGHMIKDQASVGGYPALPSTQNPVALPITSRTIQNDQMRSAVEQWLCNLSRAAGASDDPIRDRLSACPLGH